VATGVERRVGQHRDSDELYPVKGPLVERIRHVSSTAPASCLSAPIDVKALLVHLIGPLRNYGAVGTNQVAHCAPDARVGGISPLPNAVIDLMDIGGRGGRADFGQCWNLDYSFSVHAQFYCLNGANGGASTAQSAFFFVPLNLPEQVLHT
jgi:hypothetical protein